MSVGSAPVRVLVVDDDEANLRTFRRVFRTQLDIELAPSGERALELLGGTTYDAVLSDFAMPGMNGVKLLERVRGSHPQVARLLITAHSDLPEVIRAARSGLAASVIPKPWSAEEVLAELRLAIADAAGRRES